MLGVMLVAAKKFSRNSEACPAAVAPASFTAVSRRWLR